MQCHSDSAANAVRPLEPGEMSKSPSSASNFSAPQGGAAAAGGGALAAARRRVDRLRKYFEPTPRAVKFRNAFVPVTTVLVMCAMVGSMTGVYTHALLDPLTHLDRLTVGVLNHDVAFAGVSLGPTLQSGFLSAGHVKWKLLDPNTTLEEMRHAVWRDSLWAGVYIPENFTTVFLYAFKGLNPTQTVATAYANNLVAVSDYAKSYTTTIATDTVVTSVVSAMRSSMLQMMFAGKFGNASSRAPADMWVAPLGQATVQLHPEFQYGWFIGNITTMVFCWVPTMVVVYMIMFVVNRSVLRDASTTYIICLRFAIFIVDVVIESAIITGITKHFGYEHHHGWGSFWGTMVLGKLAYGFGFIFPLLTLTWGAIGRPIAVFLMFLQMVTCSGLYDSRLCQTVGFRNIGLILPMYHLLQLTRYVSFDSMPADKSQHIGVLFAWFIWGVFISIVGSIFIEPFMRRTDPYVPKG